MKILIREIDESLGNDDKRKVVLEAEEEMLREILLQAFLLRDANGALIGDENPATRESVAAHEAASSAPLPEIARTEAGKPYLKDMPDFYYNISHSGKYVVLAASYYDAASIRVQHPSQIGVDIQERRPVREGYDAVAARYYTEQEAAFLAGFDEEIPAQRDVKERVFYELWSIKEAYLKCIGTGLPGGLASCDIVRSNEHQDAGWIRDRESGKVTARYLLLAPPDPSYVMAVCVKAAE